ncbi:hypothetical protein HaLaN_08486 [Haematococcus lacustris]|uniref:Uncharacterized protein n=1 Tax=Haematococcus lacustris TaxID=44745 RepID=A0A699YRE0_HAELA|nr:hypothetical protein HaLaN_08486 [Haematococcus lacustris]
MSRCGQGVACDKHSCVRSTSGREEPSARRWFCAASRLGSTHCALVIVIAAQLPQYFQNLQPVGSGWSGAGLVLVELPRAADTASAVGAQAQELKMQWPKATMARPGKRTGEGQLHSKLCCQHLGPSPSWSQQMSCCCATWWRPALCAWAGTCCPSTQTCCSPLIPTGEVPAGT